MAIHVQQYVLAGKSLVLLYGITAKVNKTTPIKFYSSARHNRHNKLLNKPVTILYNGKYEFRKFVYIDF